MNYKYSKWSDDKGSMKKSIRNAKELAENIEERVIDKYETEKNTINILSKKQKIIEEQNNRSEEREQDLEKKRMPGLVDFRTIQHKPSEKRAVCNERISNRYMVIQTSINPFLSTKNYIGDLDIQSSHLRPKDSNV